MQLSPPIKAWLEGDEADLKVLASLFAEGDVRVLQDSGEDAYYLAATEIDEPPADMTFDAVAGKLISRLNGLGRLANSDFKPVKLSRRYTDGQSRQQILASVSLVCLPRITVEAKVIGPDGAVVPDPPSPWGARLALAESNPDVAEVLQLLSQPESTAWVDLYKIHEIIRHSIKPRKIPELGWADKVTDSSFTGSANLPAVSGGGARHARMEGNPTRTMTLDEGRSYIRGLAVKWLDWLSEL